MKKIIIFLLLLTITLTVSAVETVFYNAKQFNMRFNENDTWTEWSGWKDSDVTVMIIYDYNVIEIDSNIKQKIKYTNITELIKNNEHIVYKASAVDLDGKNVNVFFEYRKSTFFLTLSYSDVEYGYNLVKK